MIPQPSRRLTISRSAGDLLALANSSLGLKVKKDKKTTTSKSSKKLVKDDGLNRCRILISLPDPEASVVCGELYRLSLFGVWCRLWLELRLSYLLFFYDRSDSLPIDVVYLRGYSVHKAPECDHLEGLFPMKIACKDDGRIFFFCAENEECRVKWMAAFWRACSTKPSLTIEGLNLEPEMNGVRKTSEMKRVEPDVKTESNSSFYLPQEEDENDKCTALCNDRIQDIDRIQELTEHEVLRLSTYYMQRRLSTQIKMQTLQDQLQESGKPETRVEQKLHDLNDRLQVIETYKEESERAAEQKLHQLKTKKALYLKQLSHSNSSLATASSEDEHEEPLITIITQSKPESYHQVVLRNKPDKDKAKAVERHKTFSPGDWNMVESSKPALRKVGSLDDMTVKEKRLSAPMRFLNHVRNKNRSTSDNESSSSSPKSFSRKKLFLRSTSHQEPPTSASLSPTSPLDDSSEVFATEEEMVSVPDGENKQQKHNHKSPTLRKTIKRIFSFHRHHSYS